MLRVGPAHAQHEDCMSPHRNQTSLTPPPVTIRTRLTADAVRWRCPLDWIPAETTEGVEPIEGIIGQDRAIKALKLGIEIQSPGYNVFVCGLSGTGKATTIKSLLEKIRPASPPLWDYCYVQNFADPDAPIALRLERGQGVVFRDAVREAVRILFERIPAMYQDSEFMRKRAQLMTEYAQKETDGLTEFEQSILEDGFVLGRVQDGQAIRPELLFKHGEQAVLITDLGGLVQQGAMTEDEATAIVEKYREHRTALQEALKQLMQTSREYQKLITELEHESLSMLVEAVFAELREAWPEGKVRDYIEQLVGSVFASIDMFKPKQDQEEPSEPPTEWTVNLVLDNSTAVDRPVVIETVPTYTNIFGTIERQQDENGFWFSDFTRIKPGSLLRADGGFLVLNAADALSEPYVWKTLQRVLLYRKHEMQSPEMLAQQPVSVVKPEPIDLDVKVILIGNNEIYSLMASYERDFKKIFKVKADFDYEMPVSATSAAQYAALVRKLITDEGLRHFESRAIAELYEHGCRLAGNRTRVTTQFSEIADIVREADYWCRQNSNRFVMAEHVRQAVRESRERHMLMEEKLLEMIEREMIFIDTDGERVGQVNGLAVYQGDRHAFGLPSRITAAVGAGKAGIINIEREARMSGSTHDKGMLILAGFMRSLFAQHAPITLSASISFEQSYSGVDGDSASSTEFYALLSALADVPIRQNFAVTGSVNQKGDIQPIGGVNEKIEGFYHVCRTRGLTGRQGVIIPHTNAGDLMLSHDVAEAIREGRFHIHSISRIEEGIELLTGVPAGERHADGGFTPDTIFARVARRLVELNRAALPHRKDDGFRPLAPEW